MTEKQIKRIERLRAFYMREPVLAKKIPACYVRILRQRLSFMRAYVGDRRPYTARLRRAYAEAAVLSEMKPFIAEDELIVGRPDFTPLTEEEQREYDALTVAMRGMHDTGLATLGHMALDYPKLLRVGVNGLIAEIRARKNALDLNLPENLSKDEFYEGCLVELDGLLNLQRRYAERARELAAAAQGERKEELEELHRILLRVPAEPAETFYEALQSIHFYNFCLWELYYFGRVDQYLLPYYEADLRAGRITHDRAVELFACFLLLPDAYISPAVTIDSFVGGRDRTGKPVENEVTRLALDAAELSHAANGKVAMAICRDTSEELLRRAIRINAKGYAQPALFNDDAISAGLQAIGVSPEDSHYYANTGCVEMTIIGKSGAYPVAPYHNLAAILLDAMRETPYARSLCELTERFYEKLRGRVFEENLKINRRQMERSRNGGEPLRVSCLVDDCLSRGRAVDEGGACYNHIQPNFVGFSNTIDSLAAIEYLVFREKRLTMEELLAVLDKNYEGEEALRQYILNKIPHYGQNEPFTDGLAVEVSNLIRRACKGIATYRGSFLVPGLFTYTENNTLGKRTQATPDGRRAQTPLSASSGASAGMETNGPTAALLSATGWDHRPFMGGVVINMKFSPGQMSGKGEDAMVALLRAFLARGGMEIQFNCVDKNTLLAARREPEKYRDLVVRVSGFSAYFTKLPPEIQQEIIDRNEHVFA